MTVGAYRSAERLSTCGAGGVPLGAAAMLGRSSHAWTQLPCLGVVAMLGRMVCPSTIDALWLNFVACCKKFSLCRSSA